MFEICCEVSDFARYAELVELAYLKHAFCHLTSVDRDCIPLSYGIPSARYIDPLLTEPVNYHVSIVCEDDDKTKYMKFMNELYQQEWVHNVKGEFMWKPPRGEYIVKNDPIYRKPTSKIKDVKFNGPATIVFWEDGSKTVVKISENDIFDPEKAIMMAMLKKELGNPTQIRKFFKKWISPKHRDTYTEYRFASLWLRDFRNAMFSELFGMKEENNEPEV